MCRPLEFQMRKLAKSGDHVRITMQRSKMRLHRRRRSPPALISYLKMQTDVMMRPSQVQHKFQPLSKCVRLIWGRFSTCCLRLLAPSISVVILASYHWETTLPSWIKSVLHPFIERLERKDRGRGTCQGLRYALTQHVNVSVGNRRL